MHSATLFIIKNYVLSYRILSSLLAGLQKMQNFHGIVLKFPSKRANFPSVLTKFPLNSYVFLYFKGRDFPPNDKVSRD